MKDRKYCFVFLGPVITLIIFIIIFAFTGIYPFGHLTSAYSDGINQYVPLLSELITKIKEGSSLLFSYNMGRGTNFWSQITYYLTSPLNLIALFFPKNHMDQAFALITMIKPFFISLTFSIYLKHTYKKNDLSIVFFSILWAVSGFMIASLFITAWLDAIIYFPLVILGLKRLMDGYSGWMYSLFLGLTILSSFYIGWMVCIFCIIYFIYCFISDDEVVYEGVSTNNGDNEDDKTEAETVNFFAVLKNSHLLASSFRFACASLLGGLMSAVFTLPAIYTLAYTAKGSIVNETFNFTDFWGLLASHVFPEKNIYATMTSMNCIYCFAGIISVVLLVAYFFNKDISVRKKIGNGFLFLVMWASIIFHAVYRVWHGFSEPAGYMYRFAFIYTFILIKIAFEAYEKIDKTPLIGILGGTMFAGVCTFAIYKSELMSNYFWSRYLVICVVASIAIFTAILIIITKKPKLQAVLSVVILLAVVGESIALNIGNLNTFDMGNIYGNYDELNEMLASVNRKDYEITSFTNKDTGFHEMTTYGLLYGYPSGEIYSSMSDGDYVLATSDLGSYGNRMNSENGATETTPVFNMMFPTKYVIDGSGRLKENWFHKEIKREKGLGLFANNYTMPYMYVVDRGIDDWEPFSFPVVADNLNEVFKRVTATEDNVAIYNEYKNFIFHNCTSITSLEKVELTREHDEEEHEEGYNAAFWNYLDSKMASIAYTINDVSKPAGIEFDTTAQTDGIMYIFIDTTEFTDMVITINGKTTKYYTYGDGENRTYEIGDVKKGDVAHIGIGGFKEGADEDEQIYIQKTSSVAAICFTIDERVFKSGYEKLDSMSDTEILEFDDTYVKARVSCNTDNGVLYIPMANDLGWSVYIDGEEQPLFMHKSHILMTVIDAGEHTVEMKFMPQGLVPGAIVTSCSVLILIAWAVVSRKRAVNEPVADEGKEENNNDD